MFEYYFDSYSTYLIFVIPAMLISLWAQFRVKSAFSKYSKLRSDISGAEASRRVLNANNVSGISIGKVSGNLSDFFDPRNNSISLSDSVHDVYSIAAVGVAAHEAGHAVQYAENYLPIRLRAAILPICNIGSQLSMPLILIGLLFSFGFLINLGIVFFCTALLFQLITLPVELNASKRALQTIKDNNILVSDEDIKGVKHVLNAAAMTYVAAVIVSFAHLLRLLVLAGNRRN